jgi:hypothetical protein
MSVDILEKTPATGTALDEEGAFLRSLSERIAAKAPGDVYDPLPWIIIER